MALFAALTRAVREVPLREELRNRAFCGLDRLAVRLHQPNFGQELDHFAALGRQHPGLADVVQHYLPALQALAGADAGQGLRAHRDVQGKRAVPPLAC